LFGQKGNQALLTARPGIAQGVLRKAEFDVAGCLAGEFQRNREARASRQKIGRRNAVCGDNERTVRLPFERIILAA